MTSFFRTILLYSTAAAATVVLGVTVIVAGRRSQGARPRKGEPEAWRALHFRVQPRELVRRSLARQDLAPEQVRGKVRALQSADLWARNARRGDDRNPAREPKGRVRRLRCRGGANRRWQLGRRLSGGDTRTRVSASPVQEGTVRAGDRGWCADSPDHSAWDDRDNAKAFTVGSSRDD